VTGNPYGPDKPCQRTECVAIAQYAAQDARDAAIAAGADPIDVLADPPPTVGDHLGGAHLDPADRDHYDGITTSYNAAPLAVKEATKGILAYVDAFSRKVPDREVPLRAPVEIAIQACLNEIDRLRRQVAHVQVDADRKVREASRAALDCTDHSRVISELEAQLAASSRSHTNTEAARLVLLGEHQAIAELVDAHRRGKLADTTTVDTIIAALKSINERTSRAHDRAWHKTERKAP